MIRTVFNAIIAAAGYSIFLVVCAAVFVALCIESRLLKPRS